MKHFTLFNGKRQASVHPFWNGWICITRSIRSRVQQKLLSLNSKLTVCEKWPVVLMNFSFSLSVICMIEDKNCNCYNT